MSQTSNSRRSAAGSNPWEAKADPAREAARRVSRQGCGGLVFRGKRVQRTALFNIVVPFYPAAVQRLHAQASRMKWMRNCFQKDQQIARNPGEGQL